MRSQTVHYNKLPAHIKWRAKRYAKRRNFATLEEAVGCLIDQETVEGPEYWALVLQRIKEGVIRDLSKAEYIVYECLKSWPNETFGYRRLVQRTGLKNSELKVIMSRLRSLGYIEKQNKKYITLK